MWLIMNQDRQIQNIIRELYDYISVHMYEQDGIETYCHCDGEDCSRDYLWHSRRGIMAGMMITSDGVIKYIGDTLNKLRELIFSHHQFNEMYMLRIDPYSVNLGIDYGSHMIVLCGYHGIHLGT